MADRVLETRTTAHGFRRRRYERSDGARYTTIEVPSELWRSFCRAGAASEMLSARLRKADWASKRRQAVMLASHGYRMADIAQAVGASYVTVCRWVREWRDSP